MPVSSQFGPYTAYEVLGSGGMAVVYAARDSQGSEVAIKTLAEGVSEAVSRRFRREIQTLRALRHPGLIEILDVGAEGKVPWFAMPRVSGGSLEDRLRSRGTLSSEEATSLGLQLCEALSVAHAEGILHRDLKPDNVLCAEQGLYLLTDFGLTKDLSVEASVQLSKTGVLQGTPGFWAPEQASGRGQDSTPLTDVYGMGALLYAATTGLPPIGGSSLVEILVATREQAPVPPSELAEVGPGFEAIVLRCLEKDPQARYPSLAALGVALVALREGVEPARSARSFPLAKGLTSALMVLLALVSAGAVYQHQARGAAREAAETEIRSRLSPQAEPSFASLADALAEWEAVLGPKDPDLAFARALVAISADDEPAVEAALLILGEHPGQGGRAEFLTGLRRARWSTNAVELKAAGRLLRAALRRGGVFSDWRLLHGRTLLLEGKSRQALRRFLQAEALLEGAPWRELTRRAASLCAREGSLGEQDLSALGRSLPQERQLWAALPKWQRFFRARSVAGLADLFREGVAIPTALRVVLESYANRGLARARVSGFSVHRVREEFWLLDAEIPRNRGLQLELARELEPFVVVARYLALSEEDALLRVTRRVASSRSVLGGTPHAARIAQLTEQYLALRPDDLRVVGSYAVRGVRLSRRARARAVATIEAFGRRQAEPLRTFWALWSLYNAEPTFAGLAQSTEDVARGRRARDALLALAPRIQAIAEDPAAIRACREDQACQQVLFYKTYEDLRVLLKLALARSSLAGGDPMAAVGYFREFANVAAGHPEPWRADFAWALYLTLTDLGLGLTETERGDLRSQLKAHLVAALDISVGETSRLLEVSWVAREEKPLTDAVLEVVARRLVGPRVRLLDRARLTWLALSVGEIAFRMRGVGSFPGAQRQWRALTRALRTQDLPREIKRIVDLSTFNQEGVAKVVKFLESDKGK
ncbi:MAG: protein kinase [Planctomycetes bacterium]|nr:protein kinase [Planctomycetota bacterium]